MSTAQHIFCLTIDTDPDGANTSAGGGVEPSWDGLSAARSLPGMLHDHLGDLVGRVPITWFVRIDGQLESVYGTPFYLFETYGKFWEAVVDFGDEIGWHPHLHGSGRHAGLLSDPRAACEELTRLWDLIVGNRLNLRCFRNGEGWHLSETLDQVEAFGMTCDSSAIPGRGGRPGHPRDWIGTPNHPYFPQRVDIRRAGTPRPILEVPMTTWQLEAPYDAGPRTRYINPAVHPGIFSLALEDWAGELVLMDEGIWVWVLILHPDEALPGAGDDALYAHRPEAVVANIENLANTIKRAGHTVAFTTLSEAAGRWRRSLDGEP